MKRFLTCIKHKNSIVEVLKILLELKKPSTMYFFRSNLVLSRCLFTLKAWNNYKSSLRDHHLGIGEFKASFISLTTQGWDI